MPRRLPDQPPGTFHHMHFARCLGALAAAAAALSAQTPLTTVRVTNSLSQPVCALHPPGDDDRVFFAEQLSGKVRLIDYTLSSQVQSTPFLDLGSRINNGGGSGERGLLGFCFHPDFANNGHVFVNYTRASDSATVIERYTVSASNRNVGDPQSRTTILGPIAQPSPNHNGGCLAFGNDGFLYIATGDGNFGGDPTCNAQNGQSLLGKFLRIDVDGGAPYAIPPGNPFVGNPAFRDEIWSVGWRNPWRFSFDAATGDLYAGDVGEDAREEISYERGNSAGGLNFGWKLMEGTTCFGSSNCSGAVSCNDPSLQLPIHEYTTGGNCAVIGGYVYRGCAIPDLVGTYFFGDFCSAKIWSFRFDGQSISEFQDRTQELAPPGTSLNRIQSFGVDARGEIYVIDRDGEVFKIVPNTAPASVDLGFGDPGGNGVIPRFELCGSLDPGTTAELILRRAPAQTAATFIGSNTLNPLQLFFGTVVPNPPTTFPGFGTDSQGRLSVTVPGAAGPATVYGQWVVLDPGAPFGVSLSNALQINF